MESIKFRTLIFLDYCVEFAHEFRKKTAFLEKDKKLNDYIFFKNKNKYLQSFIYKITLLYSQFSETLLGGFLEGVSIL